MDVTKIEENSDGSATLHLDLTEEEARLLIEFAVITLLKEKIKEHEHETVRMPFLF